ncbi:hypothetical protein [Frigoribacterium sp. CG_9.8]|uniref:hypothetical protein n=1 Tax=Frigoribacterium sp. CG_9.8 TaxID=2787733 RepID=UPI0018C8E255|nr:hypothetical protein [Frigoribacterium sp. CG_9.8]MBG6106584.1 hypothetical protein [Frigoribacterium sp. CG_9.8]
MTTTTLNRPIVTTAPAAPLTDREADALLTQSATLERPNKVKGTPLLSSSNGAFATSSSRAWSRGGAVD